MSECGCAETYPQLVSGKVSHGPGCARAEKTPLEEAIDRAMRRNDPQSPQVLELDAEAIADRAVKHWGDDAPKLLARALELARAKVAVWSPPPPAVAPEGGG